ncbi:MAG: ribonuclease P protein component [Chloroflexota bacterium]
MGLRRDLRLRRRSDFDAVFKGGRIWADQLLVLRTLPNSLDHNRYGFVTSKKLGGAVVRNRTRRRLREIARETMAVGGYDVVLSAKTAAARAEFSDLRSSVGRLFVKGGLVERPAPGGSGKLEMGNGAAR